LERRVIVEFGPSRSKRFAKALTEAENGPGECRQLEPDRYRVSFTLGEDAATYTSLARLLERVRHRRATEISERAIRDIMGENPPGPSSRSPLAPSFAPCLRGNSRPTSTELPRSQTSHQKNGESLPVKNRQAEETTSAVVRHL
jgi:hypothetical protein